MKERRRKFEIVCRECNKIFMAKKSNAMYCTNACRQRAQQKKIKAMKKREEEGPIVINPFFLTRGDIYKNLSTGITITGGAA
jgi:hypothetical protein